MQKTSPGLALNLKNNYFRARNAKDGYVGYLAGDDDEKVLEAMLDADVDLDDVQCNDGKITLFAPASQFYQSKTAVLESFPDTNLEVQEITFLPQATTSLGAEDVPVFEKFMNMLNECEDVQEVYHNAELPD